MTTHAIARLEADRDNIKNNIKVRERWVETQKADLLEELHNLNRYREALKEVEEAIEKLKAE
ncbi:hypothetical protein [Salmonella phage 118970_sal2]|uniref:Uncharacterized protein n=2 Tax=Epseptimavirus TaxID=2732017 RepID=A0A192Y796_9CAUD|nr:hypothetical protein BOW73_gp174 [Salmonella phage 100268_sal2]YP_009323799.1 hypothetical protein BOX13_gp070 [Salmonella phage 118970_sal2]ANH50978.1 hypothetical protein [Salmonella phage 118970_sal2]ANM45567.1 hypothetical protein [Salmonella phage 100268_sal2]